MPSIPTQVCQKLVSRAGRKCTVGSHSVEMNSGKEVLILYRYHNSIVCVENPVLGKFYVDNCGYSTVSTTWAIRSYEKLLTSQRGQVQVTKEQAKNEGWAV